jgi:hypothetical protein
MDHRSKNALRVVKVVHTAAWAVFAGCILAIPFFAWRRAFPIATVLIAIVSGEVIVLVMNSMRCPLTGIAERYTDDRHDNFDIYLPRWLAKYNKRIFGSLFLAGVLLTLARWQGWLR